MSHDHPSHSPSAAEVELAQRFAGIRQWGDPVLREAARPVDVFDDAIRSQADQMLEIMDRADGIGLAAPQVGITRRLVVYREPDTLTTRVLVNPRVTTASDEQQLGLEGCLSIGYSRIAVEVSRSTDVTVSAQDADGADVEIVATGRHARVLQHEIDHLDGVLMLDRIDPEQRKAALRALRLGEPFSPPASEPE